ncbi:hypothetical protein PROFUN_08020 [Planoprotostelium fungivorum]|uniref:DH domain-containing protein n=1 Tax=Planoprotostelium fungivorum TaxID=1890364 RepID=A0A2P6MVD4_9EUKA|nr:hypothetical protein PROFUN_08020 [Planoprotostelium fungivorum]
MASLAQKWAKKFSSKISPVKDKTKSNQAEPQRHSSSDDVPATLSSYQSPIKNKPTSINTIRPPTMAPLQSQEVEKANNNPSYNYNLTARQRLFEHMSLRMVQSAVRGFLARRLYQQRKSLFDKRQHIANEIMTSEMSYVHSLHILIKQFYEPMEAASQLSSRIRRFERNDSGTILLKDSIRDTPKGSPYASKRGESSIEASYRETPGSAAGDSILSPRQKNILSGLPSPSPRSSMDGASSSPQAPSPILAGPQIPVTKEDVRTIFSQVHVITAYNERLCDEIKKRICTWGINQRLGDIFVRMTAFLKTYVDYVNNYNNAMACVDRLKSNVEFSAWLEGSETMVGASFKSFLIMPIQRIPRYVLLLEDLLRHTPENHTDFNDLVKALERVKGVAQTVNDKKRAAEKSTALIELAEQLEHSRQNILAPHRYLIYHGDLRHEGNTVSVYLTNDLFLVAKDKMNGLTGTHGKKKIVGQMWVDRDLKVQRVASQNPEKTGRVFTVSDGIDTMKFKASNEETMETWLQQLENQREQITVQGPAREREQ